MWPNEVYFLSSLPCGSRTSSISVAVAESYSWKIQQQHIWRHHMNFSANELSSPPTYINSISLMTLLSNNNQLLYNQAIKYINFWFWPFIPGHPNFYILHCIGSNSHTLMHTIPIKNKRQQQIFRCCFCWCFWSLRASLASAFGWTRDHLQV